MSRAIRDLRVIRQNLWNVADNLSVDEITKIPTGFNNHILWNICHVLVTQQLLVYKLSEVPMLIEDDFVNRYRKGTFPADSVTDEEDWSYASELYFSSIDQLEKDLNNTLFKTYNEYTTSFGITLCTTREAIEFNNLHESMHLGTVLSMKHLL